MMRTAPIETAVEVGAAIWFAACTAISVWLIAPFEAPASLMMSLIGAALAGLPVLGLMRRRDNYVLPDFELQSIEFPSLDELLLMEEMVQPASGPVDELVLTLAQRLGAEHETTSACRNELLLEDVLTRIDPESRVIRLFDPAAMPTAGELQSRIDRHLQNREAPAYPDAAQALNDALADLRRSLR